jgi:hypothetical protein
LNPKPRTPPPRKKKGQQIGPRRFDGDLRDIATQADLLGVTQKQLRSQVARGLIPFRRLGRRIVFRVEEISAFLDGLPGVSPAEALLNIAARNGTGVR